MNKSDYWWIAVFLTLLIIQLLIVNYWAYAKYATIVNLGLFLLAMVAYANASFRQMAAQEKLHLLEQSEQLKEKQISQADLSKLPIAVQKWLISSGVLGQKRVSTVSLNQKLALKLQPEQKDWNEGGAEQYFSVNPPAFHWTTNIKMNALLHVLGRDKFEAGKGEMLIKLLALIPVADAKDNDKIDQATLQRYLAEIVWFPSAALSPYIVWEHIDEYSAKATMNYGGTSGSGTFYFDKQGSFHKFVALRYKDAADTTASEWTVNATKIEEKNGIKIPTHCQASWTIDGQQWTWLKLEVTHVEYDVEK